MIGTDNEACREAWVKSVLAQIPAGSRLLDAGAGTQRFRGACKHLEYVAQDFALYDGQGDGRGLQTSTYPYGPMDLVCDIAAIPVPDHSFDVVLCTEVLEHVPEPCRVLQELTRILRPEGLLIITAPFASLTHFAPYHFCTGFSRYFYEHHLPLLGFEIVEITPNGGYFDFVAQEILRLAGVSRQYANVHLPWMYRLASRVLLSGLGRFRKSDKGSADLGCFGYHVRARKHLNTTHA